MGAEITPPFMQGICVPWLMGSSHLWASESNYTQQDPLVGPAEAQQPSVLRLETSGTQSNGGSLTIQTQRAGHPGPEGAAFIHKPTSAAADAWRGRDIQQLSAIETVRHTTESGVTSATVCDGASLPDGSTFVLYLFDDGSTISLRVIWRRPGVSSWTEVTLQDDLTALDVGALAYNPLNGAVYVCHWIAESSIAQAQVRTHRLTYDASSDSWTATTTSRWALKTPLSTSGGSLGFVRGRLRMAFNANGQCLLIGAVLTNNGGAGERNQVVQYASTSEAGQFDQIVLGPMQSFPVSVTFYYHSLFYSNGRFYLYWPQGAAAIQITLTNAYASVISRLDILGTSLATLVDFDVSVIQLSGGVAVQGAISFWLDEDGTQRMAALYQVDPEQDDDGTGYVFMMQSTDDGATWLYVGDADRLGTGSAGATIYDSMDGDIYLMDFVGCSQRGRQVLFTNHVAPSSTTDLSVHAVYFGGYTTVEMPGRIDYPATYQRYPWTFTYLPMEVPEVHASQVVFGAGASVLTADGLNVDTTSNTRYWSVAVSGDTIAGGIAFKWGYNPLSGGDLATIQRGFSIQSADGTNDYRVEVRATTTGFRVTDTFGADLITVSGLVGPQEIMVAIADGRVNLWYRSWSADPDRPWLSWGVPRALTDNPGAAASSSQIVVGHFASSTAETDVYYWTYSETGVASILSTARTNPDDLIGRDYPRRGRAVGVDDGVRVSTIDGSAREGEQYQIDATASHPIERIFFSTSPTPRVQWRSDAVASGNVAENIIAFKLNDAEAPVSSVDDGKLGNELAFLYLDGINFSQFQIQGYTGGAWVTLATVDTAISGDADLRNNSLYGDDSTRQAYFHADELVDWTARVNSQINVRIVRNSPGFFGGDRSTYKQAVCRVEGATGDAYSGATELIPPRCLVIFQLKDTRYRGFRLRITAQETYHKDFRIGTMLLGHVQILATPTSRGRIIEQIPGTTTEEDTAGVRRWVDIDPGGQFLRIAWVDPVDVSPFTGEQTTDADHYEGSSVLGSRQPIAAAWKNNGHSSVPFDLQGLFGELGAGAPVIYVPRIVKATQGSEEIRVFTRQQRMFFGQLDGSVQIESVLGDELEGMVDGKAQDEWLRVATLPLRGVK